MDIIFKIKEESEFKAVVEESVTNCYNTNIDISYNSAKEEIRTIIKTTNCDSSALEKILLQICDNQERVSYVINIIKCKKNELLYLSLIYYNSKYGEVVSDFDWILKFVSGTSELKKLKYPLLQLSLTTNKNGTEAQQTFDISKDMLAKLIDVLETTDV